MSDVTIDQCLLSCLTYVLYWYISAPIMSTTIEPFDTMLGTNDWTAHIMSRLRWFQQNGMLCDTTLVASNGEEIQAHRSVLAAASKTLRLSFVAQLGTHTVHTSLSAKKIKSILQNVYSTEYVTGSCDPFTKEAASSQDSPNKFTILNWLLHDQKYGSCFCDATLGIGSEQDANSKPVKHGIYRVHSVVMAAASPVLCDLLTESKMGSYQIELNVMRDQPQNTPLLYALITSLYTGTSFSPIPRALLECLGVEPERYIRQVQVCVQQALAVHEVRLPYGQKAMTDVLMDGQKMRTVVQKAKRGGREVYSIVRGDAQTGDATAEADAMCANATGATHPHIIVTVPVKDTVVHGKAQAKITRKGSFADVGLHQRKARGDVDSDIRLSTLVKEVKQCFENRKTHFAVD